MLDKPEPDPVFEQARDKHDGPIECRFEQDRPDQWRAIVAADRSRRVGNQHGFSDDKRAGGNKHEAAERRTVIGNKQVRRQQDQVKADEKEDRRRQHFTQSRSKKTPTRRTTPTGAGIASGEASNPAALSVSRTGALLIRSSLVTPYVRSNATGMIEPRVVGEPATLLRNSCKRSIRWRHRREWPEALLIAEWSLWRRLSVLSAIPLRRLARVYDAGIIGLAPRPHPGTRYRTRLLSEVGRRPRRVQLGVMPL